MDDEEQISVQQRHNQALGRFIRDQRKKRGLKQADLVKELSEYGFDYSESAISTWESGRFTVPLLSESNQGYFLVDILGTILGVPGMVLFEALGVFPTDFGLESPDAIQLVYLVQKLSKAEIRALVALIETFLAARKAQ